MDSPKRNSQIFTEIKKDSQLSRCIFIFEPLPKVSVHGNASVAIKTGAFLKYQEKTLTLRDAPIENGFYRHIRYPAAQYKEFNLFTKTRNNALRHSVKSWVHSAPIPMSLKTVDSGDEKKIMASLVFDPNAKQPKKMNTDQETTSSTFNGGADVCRYVTSGLIKGWLDFFPSRFFGAILSHRIQSKVI